MTRSSGILSWASATSLNPRTRTRAAARCITCERFHCCCLCCCCVVQLFVDISKSSSADILLRPTCWWWSVHVGLFMFCCCLQLTLCRQLVMLLLLLSWPLRQLSRSWLWRRDQSGFSPPGKWAVVAILGQKRRLLCNLKKIENKPHYIRHSLLSRKIAFISKELLHFILYGA